MQAYIKAKEAKETKPRTRHNNPEHDLQVACVEWFRYMYPFPHGMIYAVTNGGYRGDNRVMVGARFNLEQAIRQRLKEEGQLNGIPDLHIPIARGGYGSMYIEMKNGKKGRLSDYQKERIEQLRALGNYVCVCHDKDEFMREVNAYMALSK